MSRRRLPIGSNKSFRSCYSLDFRTDRSRRRKNIRRMETTKLVVLANRNSLRLKTSKYACDSQFQRQRNHCHKID